jgi:hypothetical protein
MEVLALQLKRGRKPTFFLPKLPTAAKFFLLMV